jgi:glycerol-3-phosphate dehydrogenase
LWRRSKLGLHVEPGTLASVTQEIDDWFARSPVERNPLRRTPARQHA